MLHLYLHVYLHTCIFSFIFIWIHIFKPGVFSFMVLCQAKSTWRQLYGIPGLRGSQRGWGFLIWLMAEWIDLMWFFDFDFLMLHPGRLTAGTYSHHPFRKETDLPSTSMRTCSMLIFQGCIYFVLLWVGLFDWLTTIMINDPWCFVVLESWYCWSSSAKADRENQENFLVEWGMLAGDTQLSFQKLSRQTTQELRILPHKWRRC